MAMSSIDWEAFHRWVLALCVIRFDLEQGQVLEECCPPGALLPSDEPSVAFSSFPDSTSHRPTHPRASVHDSLFFFRVRSSSSAFLYGFVFHRQRQDARLKRGGEQKSVVVVSPRPYSSVFFPFLRVLAPLFFDRGPQSLDLAATHVANWPPPSPGKPLELSLCGATLLRAHLPATEGELFQDADLFGSFKGLLLQLWLLWELVLVGEPILVIAPTPPESSAAVAALVSLAAPLLCSLDFRPYFTIHDKDFSSLNSLQEGEPLPAMVLGVTNLFFLKALQRFPHVVAVGSGGPGQVRRAVGFGGLIDSMKIRRQGPLCLMTEHREAVWSAYQATTKADTAVLNRLVDGGASARMEESMAVVNNEVLRRHFLELTSNFLAPFGPYLRPIVPIEESSPFAEPPPLPPFRAEEFLAGLEGRGPGKFLAKRMKANWLDLYRRFLKGRNFMPWFQKRRVIAEVEQQRLWRQARMKTDINKLIMAMSELEIVDSFNAIEGHLLREIQLEQSGKGSADSDKACQKLKADLEAVFRVLPKDTQQLLLSHPQRASLLGFTI
ncbi:polarity axis stabilization protein [Wolffia australiana]